MQRLVLDSGPEPFFGAPINLLPSPQDAPFFLFPSFNDRTVLSPKCVSSFQQVEVVAGSEEIQDWNGVAASDQNGYIRLQWRGIGGERLIRTMITIVALGAAVGLVLALTGAGGGILAVPLLVFATGIGVAEAAPIGLVAVGLGAGLGALLGLRSGIVRYRAALLIAAAGMLSSPLGIWIAHRIDNRVLLALFAIILIYVAWNSYRKASGKAAAQKRRPACIRNPATGRFVWTTPCARALTRAGAAAGLMSGLLGVGGGFVIVPALQRCTDLPMASSVATSLAVIFLVSLHTVAIAIATTNFDWMIALPFCAGTLTGMLAGRNIAARINDAFIHKTFAALAALAAAGIVAVTLCTGARPY